MSYSRRDLYALGEPLGESVTQNTLGKARTYGGGDSGGSAQPTTTTAYNTNIPEYAQPYVTNMLEATQKQLFKGNTDASGNFNITGFQPYTPYSSNPADYVAGFSPLQQQAQSGIANLRTPTSFGTAMGMTGLGAAGSMGLAGQAANAGQDYYNMATNPYATRAFMNPYIQASLQPQLNQIAQQGNIAAQQAAGQATAAGAFGGTRSALQQNLAQQNALMAQQAAIGQGYNQAYNQAQQAMQYGAGLGLQGTQAGLQGMAQYGALANQLGQLGGQQLQAQEGILSAQSQAGQAQQQQQQQIINQAIQNYATAQQYPLMQLGAMSNMLRGLPMQATTTQTYQAQPSALVQGIGALGSVAGAAKAFGAKGGLPKDFERKFDVGGSVEADLHDMDDAHLAQAAKSSGSAEIRKMAARVLAERQLEEQAMGRGLGATPSGMGAQMAGGGIVAFADGDLVEDQAAPANITWADNPFAKTPEEALTKYQALLKTAGVSDKAKRDAYAEAVQAKANAIDALRSQAAGQNMMEYFSNLGTQTGPLGYALAKTGKETLPGMFARQQNVENQGLNYLKSQADIEAAKDTEAENIAKQAETLYEKGAETQEKLNAKRIEAAKLKAPTTFTQLAKGYLDLTLAKDPTIKNDPVKLAQATAAANTYAADKLAAVGMARTGVQQQAVDVSALEAQLKDIQGQNQRAEQVTQRIDARYKDENKETIADYNDVSSRLIKEKSKPADAQNAEKIAKLTAQKNGLYTQLQQAKDQIVREENAKVPRPSPSITAKGGKKGADAGKIDTSNPLLSNK